MRSRDQNRSDPQFSNLQKSPNETENKAIALHLLRSETFLSTQWAACQEFWTFSCMHSSKDLPLYTGAARHQRTSCLYTPHPAAFSVLGSVYYPYWHKALLPSFQNSLSEDLHDFCVSTGATSTCFCKAHDDDRHVICIHAQRGASWSLTYFLKKRSRNIRCRTAGSYSEPDTWVSECIQNGFCFREKLDHVCISRSVHVTPKYMRPFNTPKLVVTSPRYKLHSKQCKRQGAVP